MNMLTWFVLSSALLRRGMMAMVVGCLLSTCLFAAEPMVVSGNQFSAYLAVDGTVWTWGKNSQGQLGMNDSAFTDQLTPVQVPGLTNVIGISAGYEHCLAVKADGTVWAWGRNSEGQLGQGSVGGMLDHAVQVTLPGVNNQCTSVAAGGFHSMAMAAGIGGTLFTWGYNGQGQIGNGTTSPPVSSPFQVTFGVRAIAAGGYHSMYIDAAGQVRGFGYNLNGQLGDGTSTSPRTSAVTAIGATNALTLSCGWMHTLMTRADGLAYAWGSNSNGQVGNNAVGVSALTPVSLGVYASRVVAGGNHSMLVAPWGYVYTWGDNTYGQCHLPISTTQYATPQALGYLFPQQRALFGGIGDHTLFVLDNGQVQGWGKNDAGQLGTGATGGSNPTTQIPVANWTLEGMIAIDAGNGQSIALKADGTVWTWGSDSNGELGDDASSVNKPTPVQVTGFSHAIVAIAAGSYHCVALDSNGQVWAWGNNSSGQLGDTTTLSKNTPVQAGSGTYCRAIGAGGFHTLAVTYYGSVVAWGNNGSGQIGNGSATASFSTVTNVSSLADVWQVTGGWSHSLALKADGTVWTWGLDGAGQLGDDALFANKSAPVAVSGVSGVISIAGGQYHSLAARTYTGDNSWGGDQGGQLGDDALLTNQPTARSIATVSNSKQMSAGGDFGDFSLALRTDGTVISFGRDTYGGLGDDAILANKPTPVTVSGLANIMAVAAGDFHGLALRANGTIAAWGYDVSGQLGDDTNLTNQPTPVTVFPNWLPVVTYNAGSSISSASEPGGAGNQGSITFTRTGGTAASLPISYSISGGAVNGGDYTALSGSAIIPAGASSVSILINPLDDLIAENAETVRLTLNSSSVYTLGASASGAVSIADNDVASVVVSPTSGLNTTEGGGTATFNVRLTSQPTAGVTINFISSNTGEGSISPSSLTFTPSGGTVWSTNQTITITGVDDFVQDGNIGYQINNGGAVSGDAFYGGKAVSSVLVTNQDNDVAGFIVSAISGHTTEAGATATLTIRLTSQPTANVTIGLTSDNTAEGTVSPTSVTFTPSMSVAGGWNLDQTATVTGVNDDVADGNITYHIITGAAGTSDLNYSPLVVPDVTVINDDNDNAGVTILESGGSTNITEGGATDAYTVVLKSQPTANVTISINAGAQCSVGQSTLNFTTGNWNLPQTVTVTAIDDPVAEGAHTGSLTHSVSSSDGKYNGGSVTFTVNGVVGSTVTANITDNDIAGYTIIQSGGTTEVSEAGVTDSYTIRLNTQPNSGVSVTLNADAQVRVNGGASAVLTFSTTAGVAGGWDQPQTITVSAVNDALVEGAHLGMITGTASGGGYTSVAPPTVTTYITDNDVGTAVVVESGGTAISEAGLTDTYTVVLGVQPGSNVTVAVNADPQTQVSTDGSTYSATVNLTFTTGNYASAQTVYVKAIDDQVAEGTHTGTITHSASGSGYNGVTVANVVATITDNDTAGVTVSAMAGTVTEAAGGSHSSSYTVKLNTQPTGPVTVSLTPNSQVTVSPSTLTFTASGAGLWSTTQVVTVTAVDDTVYEGAHSGLIVHTASSGDAKYNGLAVANISPSITDNDTAPVVAFLTGTSNGAESVTARNLAVTLTFTGGTTSTAFNTSVNYGVSGGTATGGGTDYTLASGGLTFTAGQTTRFISLTVVNDSIDEIDESLIVTLSAPVNATLGTFASHTYTINDDDTAGVTITETGSGTTVAEGGTGDTYTVVLNSQPTAPVTINITGMTANGVRVNGSLASVPLIFTANGSGGGLWSTPQTVTVSAFDDVAAEGTQTETLQHAISSADGLYAAVTPANVVATILDNDTAGVTIAEVGGSTVVTEGGVQDQYTVRLNTDPGTGTVTVTATPDSQLLVSLDNSTFGTLVALTFTPGAGTWATPQTVYVKAVDDNVVEGGHSGLITHSSTHNSGATYTGLAIATVTATITDNDTAGVTIAGNPQVSESGTTDTYSVVLDRQPSSNVVISLTPDAQISVSPTNLLFTSGNWNLPQTITVTAVDDAVAEGAHSGVITHTAVGGSYTGVVIAQATATITDNDTPAVILNQSAGSTAVSESGTTDTYTVALATKPQAGLTVTINVTSDAFVTASPSTLTFTAADYNTPQTVTVSAVNDLIAQGTHTGTVSQAVTATGSPDPQYAGLVISDVVASVTDNDMAGMLVTKSGSSTLVVEGGTSDSITVQLTSAPSASVSVALVPDAQVGIGGATTLTFTSGGATAWNIPQTVTITAINNLIADGSHAGVVTLNASGATEYNGLTATTTATVTDNDVAGVIISVGTGVTAAEDGTVTGSYSVQLATMPTAPVTIAIAPNAQVGVQPATLFFTATGGSAWNVPQTVVVTAVDDQVAEGPHTGLIAHAAASADLAYQNIPIASVAPAITDNDQAGVIVSQTSGLVTSESGGTATFNLRLASKPLVNVVIGLSSSAISEGTVSPGSVTFTAVNWSTPQTVTATGVQDFIADGNQLYTIQTAAVSAAGDTNYDGMTVSNVSVTNTDIDTAAIQITESGGGTTVTESATATPTDTYGVVLTSLPTGSVTVTLSTDGQTSVSPSILTFTTATGASGGWNVVQTVTVTGIDDGIDEAATHTGVINHNASGGGYTGVSASLTANVVDSPGNASGFTVSTISSHTTETGGTATSTVRLKSKPVANVTVILASSNTAEGTVSPSSLTFTPSTGAIGGWDQTQSITVTGVDDRIDDGNVGYLIQITAVSGDTNYNVGHTGALDVAVINDDDDTVGVSISAAVLTTTEASGAGNQSSFVVALNTQPTANVTVALNGVTATEGSITPSTLIFTTLNWNVGQTVTVTGVDDDIDDGNVAYTITPSTTSTDTNYQALAGIATVQVTNVDDDTAGITVTPIAGLVTTESGGTAIFTIRLDTEPTAPVTIGVTSSDILEGTVSPTSVTFTGLDWNIPQTVTVRGVDDTTPVMDGAVAYSIITALANSTDNKYNVINPANVSLFNSDNDVPGVSIIESGGATGVTEAAGISHSDTYTVVLTTQPLHDVIITATADASSTVSPGVLAFTTSNWNVAQTMTVTAVDDSVAQGPHSSIVTHSVADAVSGQVSAYAGLTVPPVVVTVTDNDAAGFAVLSSPITTTEIGGSSTFTVALTSQPTAQVVVNLSTSDATQGSVSPTTLTFSPFAYGPQTVTVTGADGNATDDGNQPYTIVISAAVSSDATYNGVNPSDVLVTNLAVNNRPTLTSMTLGAVVLDPISPVTIAEDAVAQTVNLSGIGAGQTGEILALSNALTVTATSSNPTVVPNPVVNYGGLATGSLVFTPAANANGTATITVTVDDGGSTANGGQRLISKTFIVIVTPVNDPPIFSMPANATVNEDAPLTTVSGWATAIYPGPLSATDELGQVLTFTCSTSSDGSFTVLPSINASTGDLIFRPAPDANTTTPITVSVTLADDGGGASVSPVQTFTITITPLNDPPAFTQGPPQVITEDAGPQIITPWVTNITAGPGNEAAQSVAFVITVNDNSGLFSVAPAIDAAGTLTYTGKPDAGGIAHITYHALDSLGGVSADQVLTITINPVNDPPVTTVSLPSGRTVPIGTTHVISMIDISATDVDSTLPAPARDPALIFSLNLPPGNGTLFRNGVALAVNDTFTQQDVINNLISYTHNGGTSATDGFAFTVSDSGIAVGAVLASPPLPAVALPPATSPIQVFNIIIDRRAPVILWTLSAALPFTEGGAALLVVNTATVTDFDSVNFAGGLLTVDFASGATAADLIGLDVSGSITVSGSTLFFNGGGGPIQIGTYTIVSTVQGSVFTLSGLTAAADTVSIPAVLAALTFQNVSEAPSPALTNPLTTRILRAVLVDNHSDVSQPALLPIGVTSVNDAPVIIPPSGPLEAAAGFSRRGNVVATDIDGDLLTYSVITSPTQGTVVLDAATGDFSYTPIANPAPSDTFSVQVSDGITTVQQAYAVVITVVGQSRPTIISPAPMVVWGGATFLYTPVVTTTGLTTPSLRFELQGTLPGATFNPVNGSISWPIPPSPGSAGYYHAGIMVIDQASQSVFYQPLLLLWLPGAPG